MGYPHGPQPGYNPHPGYAHPGYGADPYGGQPGHGAQPYGAPAEFAYGAPAYGVAPYPGYAAPGYGRTRAGGGTAITAAVISLLLSLIALTGLGITLAVLLGTEATSATDEAGRAEVTLGIAIGAVPALLMLLGSILLFRRKTSGRVILILLSSLSLALLAVSVTAAIMQSSAVDAPPTLVGGLIVSAIPLTILVLAAVPATGRWIRAGKQPAHPYY